MRENIRIIVVGDAGSGKTTLITSFVKEAFEANVPRVLPEVSIPAEVTIDKVHTFLIDSSVDDFEELQVEIERADAICLVYSLESDGNYESLARFWLPMLRKFVAGVVLFLNYRLSSLKKPVILVGNKMDVRRDENSNDRVDRYILPLMNEYKEIETCVECSAKELLNVAEVFYFASKAILHPTSPLYDATEHKMKPSCQRALERIFRLCDKNKDGLLDDGELNAFQKKVFGSPLQQQELEGVKDVVRENISEGVRNNELTEKGFVYLHLLFIERGRLETIWAVLRRFGYDETVNLRHDFLHPMIKIPLESVTELSPNGFQFLTSLFQAHDRDKDGILNSDELSNLFSTAPVIPWINDFRTYESAGQHMTLNKFFAMWSMITLIDYQTALSYLAYLGYEGDIKDAIRIVPSGRGRGKKITNSRTVFHGLVLGPTGCGKTEFLKGLIDHKFSSEYKSNQSAWTVVNAVEVNGLEKYLVLEEVKSDTAWDILQDEHRLKNTDVLIFLYDTNDENSFSYLANLRKLCDLNKCPIVFIGTKTDLGAVHQNYELLPEEYTTALGLAAPILVSMKDRETPDLFNIITGVAMNPSVAIPVRAESSFSSINVLLGAAVVASALAIGGFVIYKNFKHPITVK